MMVASAFAWTVTLGWNQNSETNLAGYITYMGLQSGSYNYSRFVPYPQTNNAISNLSAGQTYFFAVTATNTVGLESAKSTELSVTIPSTPTNVTVNMNGSSLVLNWPAGYILQMTTNLVSPVWNDLATNSPYVFDTSSLPMAFFRLRLPITTPPPVTNPPPVLPLVLSKVSTNTSATVNNVHNLTSVPSNSFLVVTVSAESALRTNTTTSVPPLNWTRVVKAVAASSGDAELWTATYTNGGNLTITSTWTGANMNCSSVAYVFQNAASNKNYLSAVAQSTPTVTLSTTKTNSYLICVSSDWNAIAGAITYRGTPVTPVLVHYVATKYQTAHWYKYSTNMATYTLGESSPTGQKAGTIVYEVKGN